MVVSVITAGRYVVKNELVKSMVVYVTLADERLHQDAAAYVHAHDIRNHLIT